MRGIACTVVNPQPWSKTYMKLSDLFFYQWFDVWRLYAVSDIQPGRELMLYDHLHTRTGEHLIRIERCIVGVPDTVMIEGYALPQNGQDPRISDRRIDFKVNGVYRRELNLVGVRPGWGPPQVPQSWIERGVI